MPLLQSGDLDGAIEVYRELTRREPANAEAFYDLGLALKQKDRFEEAEPALRSAQRLDPSMPEAPYTLGVVLWQTGRRRRGRAALSRRHRAPARLRRRALHARDRPAAARRRRRRARGVPRDDPHQPALAEAYTSIGQLLTAAHDSTGAAEAFANAARLNKVKADSQAAVFAVNAGRERLRQNDLAGAIERFREAVWLDPNNAQAHYQLGLALRRKGALRHGVARRAPEGSAPGAVSESGPLSCSHKGPRNTRSNADSAHDSCRLRR